MGKFLYRVMMWSIIALNMIVSLTIAQKATFDNYKVFSIVPTTEEQIEQLYQMIQIHDGVSRSFVQSARISSFLRIRSHKFISLTETYKMKILQLYKLISYSRPVKVRRKLKKKRLNFFSRD